MDNTDNNMDMAKQAELGLGRLGKGTGTGHRAEKGMGRTKKNAMDREKETIVKIGMEATMKKKTNGRACPCTEAAAAAQRPPQLPQSLCGEHNDD